MEKKYTDGTCALTKKILARVSIQMEAYQRRNLAKHFYQSLDTLVKNMPFKNLFFFIEINCIRAGYIGVNIDVSAGEVFQI